MNKKIPDHLKITPEYIQKINDYFYRQLSLDDAFNRLSISKQQHIIDGMTEHYLKVENKLLFGYGKQSKN